MPRGVDTLFYDGFSLTSEPVAVEPPIKVNYDACAFGEPEGSGWTPTPKQGHSDEYEEHDRCMVCGSYNNALGLTVVCSDACLEKRQRHLSNRMTLVGKDPIAVFISRGYIQHTITHFDRLWLQRQLIMAEVTLITQVGGYKPNWAEEVAQSVGVEYLDLRKCSTWDHFARNYQDFDIKLVASLWADRSYGASHEERTILRKCPDAKVVSRVCGVTVPVGYDPLVDTSCLLDDFL